MKTHKLVITKPSNQEVLPPINSGTVLAVWRRLEDSKHWSAPVRIAQCDQRQNIVLLQGAGHELFEVVDMEVGRVLTEEEFPNELFAGDSPTHTFSVIWDLEKKHETRRQRRRTKLRALRQRKADERSPEIL